MKNKLIFIYTSCWKITFKLGYSLHTSEFSLLSVSIKGAFICHLQCQCSSHRPFLACQVVCSYEPSFIFSCTTCIVKQGWWYPKILIYSGIPEAETFGRNRKFSAFGLRFRPPNIKSEYGRKLNFRFTKTFTKKEKEVHLFLCCESWQLVRFICWLHAPWEFHYSVVTAKNGLRKPSLIFLVNTIKGTYSTLWIEINQGQYYFVQNFSKNTSSDEFLKKSVKKNNPSYC